ncbi:hypothetical protein ACOMCU_22545 [Lysinibacillus sp. UGB7]|uniref:hypothetical protein n=1 Tax=Lysinibacillus sp. UGB7 TaxID=3411039 RepID=UPI003B7942D3
MNFDLNIDFEDKFQSLNMIDMLIIFKLIEEYTNTKLSNKTIFYSDRHSEYISTDDVWWPLDYFLYKTEIGELEYDGEQYKLTLYNLSSAYLQKAHMSIDSQNDLESLVEDLNEKMMEPTSESMFSLISFFCEDELIFRGYLEFECGSDMCWHTICESLLEAHTQCLKYIKE